jgi:hypothetical protein
MCKRFLVYCAFIMKQPYVAHTPLIARLTLCSVTSSGLENAQLEAQKNYDIYITFHLLSSVFSVHNALPFQNQHKSTR